MKNCPAQPAFFHSTFSDLPHALSSGILAANQSPDLEIMSNHDLSDTMRGMKQTKGMFTDILKREEEQQQGQGIQLNDYFPETTSKGTSIHTRNSSGLLVSRLIRRTTPGESKNSFYDSSESIKYQDNPLCVGGDDSEDEEEDEQQLRPKTKSRGGTVSSEKSMTPSRSFIMMSSTKTHQVSDDQDDNNSDARRFPFVRSGSFTSLKEVVKKTLNA